MKKSLRITSSIIVLALIISLIMPSISGAFYSLPNDNQRDELISPGAEYTDGEIIVGFIKNEQSEDDKFDIEVIEENLLPTPIVAPNTQRPEYSLAFSKEGIITTTSDTFSDSGEVLRDTYLGSIGTDGNITFSNTGKLYNSTMSIRPMSVVNGNKYYVIASYYGSKAHGKTLRYLEEYNELVPEGFLSDKRSESDNLSPVRRNETGDAVTIKVPKVPKTGDEKGRVIEEITSRQQLNNPDITIGTGDGSAAVNVIKRELPNANIAYLEAVQGYQTVAQGKIDAYIFERLQMEKAMDHGLEGVKLLDENMEEQLNIAVGISPNCKIPDFENELNSFIKSIKEDGILDDMYNRWVNEENENMPFIEPPSNPKYHLVIGTTGIVQPYSYYKGNELCGLDIELGYRFAKYLDADVTFKVYDYSGIIPACATGNIDCIMANLNITPERAQSIPFSDVLFTQPIAIMVKDTTNVKTGITDYIADGFYKTFISESRWKLLVQGLLTTVLITLFSVIFGTVLGFVTYLLCKDGNKIANSIYKVFSTLIQGMPVVVLLMILYYVVFGTLSLSATIVSIVGFTLVFAIGVHGLLVTGSKSIDIGQYEAAYALGHSRLSTFFTIILPQIIPLMIESYMGEIIALIKATAVVGYIAVVDLTKVGDIIRNRTYEAFFPLIAAAILYFVLEGIVILIISRVKTRVTPKMRKNRRLLKGVKLHD